MDTPKQWKHLILVLLSVGQLLREGGKSRPDLHGNRALKTSEVGLQEVQNIAIRAEKDL